MDLRHKRVPTGKVEYLKFLSGPLNVELQSELYKPHVTQHHFFKAYSECSKPTMKQLCSKAMHTESHAKQDTLFFRCKEARFMHFLTKGSLAYRFRESHESTQKKTIKLQSGEWCCEQAIWTFFEHWGHMKSLTDTEIVTVTAAKFLEVTCAHRVVYDLAREYARRYAVCMKAFASFGQLVTDVPPEHTMNLDARKNLTRNGSDEELEIQKAEELEMTILSFSDSEDEHEQDFNSI